MVVLFQTIVLHVQSTPEYARIATVTVTDNRKITGAAVNQTILLSPDDGRQYSDR